MKIVAVMAVLLCCGCEKLGVEEKAGFTAVTNEDGMVVLVASDGQRYMMMTNEPHAK